MYFLNIIAGIEMYLMKVGQLLKQSKMNIQRQETKLNFLIGIPIQMIGRFVIRKLNTYAD